MSARTTHTCRVDLEKILKTDLPASEACHAKPNNDTTYEPGHDELTIS